MKAMIGNKPLRPSRFIGGVDVLPGDVRVRIESVEPALEVWLNGKKDRIPALEVSMPDGVVRYMKVNASNEGMLCRLFGQKAAAWAGKEIVLYHDASVKAGGRRVGGVRIREAGAEQQRKEPPTSDDAIELHSTLMALIESTESLEVLQGDVATSVKQAAEALPSKMLGALRSAYKAKSDSLEGAE